MVWLSICGAVCVFSLLLLLLLLLLLFPVFRLIGGRDFIDNVTLRGNCGRVSLQFRLADARALRISCEPIRGYDSVPVNDAKRFCHHLTCGNKVEALKLYSTQKVT